MRSVTPRHLGDIVELVATILSHRGQWDQRLERNSPSALIRGLQNGFGVETDVRDHDGKLVISHDPPNSSQPAFADVLRAKRELGGGPLAINIKADGLQRMLGDAVAQFEITDYFVFDMSIPDALGYLKAGIPLFTRQSEYEPEPALYAAASGVWLDCFVTEWFDEAVLAGHLSADKRVCIVSPELHNRDHRHAWKRWASWPSIQSGDVMICTDHPTECAEVFRAS
jgi:hypothetical protein